MMTSRRKKYKAGFYGTDFFVVRHLKNFIEARLKELVTDGRHVADIGCGEQPMRSMVEASGGIYTGIDVAQNSQNTVHVIAGIDSVPLPDDSFDVIVLTEVLEHVADIDGAFQEIGRLIKPGGRILLTVPFAYPLHEEPFDYMRPTPHMITRCASKYNLEIAELQTSGNEIEVIATVWGNMWERMAKRDKGKLIVLRNALMSAPVNLIAMGLSAAFGSLLPRKYYLSAMAVLSRKKT